MSLLLNIPLELRELIIGHVLYAPTSPPVTPIESDGVEYNDLRYKAWPGGGAKTYYTQQMETRAILQRMKVDYILDISVKDDLTLFLIWLSVPCLTTHISTLYANVRLFGNIADEKIIRSQLGDGGRLGFHWSFYAALERFLRYGPVAEKRSKEKDNSQKSRWNIQEFEDRGMLIDTLVLDFQSAELELAFPPENITYDHWSSRHCGSDKFDRSEIPRILSTYTTRPEWLCRYMQDWICHLLGMDYCTSRYGQLLYERIGTIQMLVDGQLEYEFDLAAWLAGLNFTDPRETMGHLPANERVPGFWKWKRDTLLRREAQGLPVRPPSDDASDKRDEEYVI